jgi:GT2 family glycosyltransferase
MKTIAVVLTCFNRKAKTVQCLDHLFRQAGIGKDFLLEVYLVDDGSTDGTSEEVNKRFPDVNIIKGNGELYWNGGMHLAWKTAVERKHHDFYLWLNDDTFVFPDAVQEMLACYDLGGEAIICGSTSTEKTKEFSYGGRTMDEKILIPNGQLQQCQIMNGNFVLISNAITKEVGIIDPIFPHSMGDHDYGLRAIKKGFKILITRKYIGSCEKHEKLANWCNPDVPLKKRWKALYSPLGNHPHYFFIYENRHYGFLTAAKHFLTIHLRALVPSLWK